MRKILYKIIYGFGILFLVGAPLGVGFASAVNVGDSYSVRDVVELSVAATVIGVSDLDCDADKIYRIDLEFISGDPFPQNIRHEFNSNTTSGDYRRVRWEQFMGSVTSDALNSNILGDMQGSGQNSQTNVEYFLYCNGVSRRRGSANWHDGTIGTMEQEIFSFGFVPNENITSLEFKGGGLGFAAGTRIIVSSYNAPSGGLAYDPSFDFSTNLGIGTLVFISAMGLGLTAFRRV